MKLLSQISTMSPRYIYLTQLTFTLFWDSLHPFVSNTIISPTFLAALLISSFWNPTQSLSRCKLLEQQHSSRCNFCFYKFFIVLSLWPLFLPFWFILPFWFLLSDISPVAHIYNLTMALGSALVASHTQGLNENFWILLPPPPLLGLSSE